MDKIADFIIEILLRIMGHKIFKKPWVKRGLWISLILLVGLIWLQKQNQLLPLTSQIITFNNPVRFEKPDKARGATGTLTFKNTVKPKFTLLIPQASTSEIGQTKVGDWETPEETIKAVAVHKATNRTVPVNIKKVDQGKFEIELAGASNHFQPGAYSLKVTSKETFFYTRDLSQDFSWGVLAINTNKSAFTQMETAKLSFGVVDDEGHTICDAKLFLIITDPNGQKSELDYKNGRIRQSGVCHGDSYTEIADYLAEYKTNIAGTYQMDLTAETKNGKKSISDTFEVKTYVPFDIERTAFPSRIYPPAIYPTTLTVRANQEFKGLIVDTVPGNFEVECKKASITKDGLKYDTTSKVPTCKIVLEGDLKKIIWAANLGKGETAQVFYTIKFPPISPEFYLLGPIKTFAPDTPSPKTILPPTTVSYHPIFEESRQWQVASDATTAIDQQINIIDQTYSTTSQNYAPTDNSLGIICYKRSSNTTDCATGGGSTSGDYVPTPTAYFEADFKNSAGKFTTAGLFDITASAIVPGSEISTDSLYYTRVRSDPITLVTGHEYTVRVKAAFNGTTATITGARLILLQSAAPGSFTDTQTIVEVGANETTTSTSMATLTNPKYFQYDNSKYDGTKTAYFEATIKGGLLAAVPGSPTNTGAVTTGAGANDTTCSGTGTDKDWVNAGNIVSSNNTYATNIGEVVMECVNATNFDFSSIPGTATIDGIVVESEQKESNGGDNVLEETIQLIQAGSRAGDNKATLTTEWPTSEAYVTYGASNNTWGLSWVPSDFTNDTNFGVSIQADGATGTTVTASIDHVRMTIYYTTAATAESTSTVTAELYNRTDKAVVTNSEISTTNTSWTRIRSAALTTNWDTSNADEYEVRFKTSDSAVATGIANAKIVIGQNTAGGITKLQTYHQYINSAQTSQNAMLGTFATTSQAQLIRRQMFLAATNAVVGSSTYIYVLGGNNAAGDASASTVYKALVNFTDFITGNVSSFSTTSQAQFPRSTDTIGKAVFTQTVGPSTYLYVVGGDNAATGNTSTVYKATLGINNAQGNVGTFATTSQGVLPIISLRHTTLPATVGSSTYVYVLGGCTQGSSTCSTYSSSVYKSTLNSSNGNIAATFSTTSQAQLLATRQYLNALTFLAGPSTYIYALGGCTGSFNCTAGNASTVYKATLNSSGNVGAFATTNQGQLLTELGNHTSFSSIIGPSTYIYVIGGSTSSANARSTVYRATFDNNTGHISGFNTTNQAQLPSNLSTQASVTSATGVSTYFYVLGGYNGSSELSTVYKSQITNEFDSFGYFNLYDPSDWDGGTFTYFNESTLSPNQISTQGVASTIPGGLGPVVTSMKTDAGTFATTSQGQLLKGLGQATVTNLTFGSSTYVYVVGGNEGGTMRSTIYKSTLGSSDGNAGTFATTSQSQLPKVFQFQSMNTFSVTSPASTYVYIIGGDEAGTVRSTVYKSTFSTAGDTGAFATTSQTQMPALLTQHSSNLLTVGSSTYVYVLGGNLSGTGQRSTIYKSTLDSAGNTSTAFSTTSQAQMKIISDSQVSLNATIGSSTYIYALGGWNGTVILSTVYKGTLDATTGNISTFTTTSQSQLKTADIRSDAAGILTTIGLSRYIYFVGGEDAARQSTIYKSALSNGAGDVSGFATTNQAQLPIINSELTATSATVGSSSYLYILAGTSGTVQSTVYKSTLTANESGIIERNISQNFAPHTNQGQLGAFATTNQAQMDTAKFGLSSVVANIGGVNYLYNIGGNNSTVFRSNIDTNANITGFATTSQAQLLQVTQNQDAFSFKNPLAEAFIFLFGGNTSSAIYSTVYKSALNSSNGSTGAFSTTNQGQLPQYLRNLSVAPISKPANYLYVVGGCDTASCTSSVSTVYKSTINIPADTGAFATTSQVQLLAVRGRTTTLTTLFGSSTYTYVIGGTSGSTIYKSTLNSSTGNAGAFATTSQVQLTATRGGHSSIIPTFGSSTYVYMLGGFAATHTSTVFKATLSAAAGNLGTFATTSQSQLSTLSSYHTTLSSSFGSSTFIYMLGGDDSTAARLSTVYKSILNSTSGDFGTFATTSQSQLLSRLFDHTSAISTIGSSTYVYLLGGTIDSNDYLSTVYKATINSSTGNLGTFATTSQGQSLIQIGQNNAITTAIGSSSYIYLIGASNNGAATFFSTIYKATLDGSDGNISTFATTNQGQLPALNRLNAVISANFGPSSYIYVVGGGVGAGTSSTIYKSTLNTSPNLSEFATTSQAQVPQLLTNHKTVSAAVSGTSYLYTLGGFTPTEGVITGGTGDIASAFATTSQGQILKTIFDTAALTQTIGSSTYVYVLGGFDNTIEHSTVYKSTFDSSTGNLGAFATTSQSQFLTGLANHTTVNQTVGSSTYVYVLGDSSNSTVYKSTFDSSTGNLGAFATTSQSQFLKTISEHSSVNQTVGSSTYVYVLGGIETSTVYKSTLDSSTGNIGAFATTSQAQFREILYDEPALTQTIGSSTYVYVLGGFAASPYRSTVYKSTLDSSTGNIGAFATTSQSQLLTTNGEHTLVNQTIGSSTYVYVLGGATAAVYSTVYKSTLDSSTGNIGAFATTNQSQLLTKISDHASISQIIGQSAYVYVLVGFDSTFRSTVYKSLLNTVATVTGDTISTVYKSQVDSNLNAAAFATTSQTQLPILLHDHGAINAKIGETNFLYVLGGCSDTTLACSFNATGDIGTFSTTSQGQLTIKQQNTITSTIGSSTYVYALGGLVGSTAISTIYKSTINTTSGNLGAFATTSQAQLLRMSTLQNTITSTVGSSTYVYVLGGLFNTTVLSTVYKSTLNSSTGNLGAFATTSQAQLLLVNYIQNTITSTVGSSTYVYVLGGYSGANTLSTVYKSTLNSTSGNLGAFATTSQSQLLQKIRSPESISPTIGSSTYVYVLGGFNGSIGDSISTIYRSTINSTSGDLGAFATTSQAQFPSLLDDHSTITSALGSSTYVYILGGSTPTILSTVYKSTLNSTSGDLGAFATTSQAQLRAKDYDLSTPTSTLGPSTYIYIVGGTSTDVISTVYKAILSANLGNTVYKAQVDTSANVGSFSQTNIGQLPQDLALNSAISAKFGGNSYLYVLGGCNGVTCGTNQSSVYKGIIHASEYDTAVQNANVASSWLVINFAPAPTVQVVIRGGTTIRGGANIGR